MEDRGARSDGEQIVAELATGQHVDDEVDRRVEDGHEIADGRVVVVPAAAASVSLVHERPDDPVDESRRLTDTRTRVDNTVDWTPPSINTSLPVFSTKC